MSATDHPKPELEGEPSSKRPRTEKVKGVDRLYSAFERAKREGRKAFVGFVTAGFPTVDESVDILLGMQKGGADVIEVGLPFSDPLAEGPTIQHSSHIALQNGVSVAMCFDLVANARERGLTVPVVMMGYFNPILQFGVDAVTARAAEVGADGFIVVDLPPEEAVEFRAACATNSLSFIPLVTPTTTDERLALLTSLASSFVYCIAVTGVTGARAAVADDLPEFIARVRAAAPEGTPLAVGFGISTPEHVKSVGTVADATVVGSAIIKVLDAAPAGERAAAVQTFISNLISATEERPLGSELEIFEAPSAAAAAAVATPAPPADSVFGPFGGSYIPETLSEAIDELTAAFYAAKDDPEFIEELAALRRDYVGGPTPLTFAKRATEACGGARIWLKRSDLSHTGAHKINNALGQCLLARRLGKTRIIAETGAGQHGVATATACALFGLECVVYMGAEDVERQKLNVFKMRMMGTTVHPVQSGSKTLKDAINEAMRDWVTNVRTTHYIIGSAVGPHPFPVMVRHFQSVIGTEARAQMLEKAGKLPDVAVACVGGGSNAIGLFAPFVNDESVGLVGVEAGGANGVTGKHGAPLSAGRPGVLHGARSYVLQNDDGQIDETHSISAGLDYPGVGPEHSHLKDIGRATYVAVTDGQALEAMKTLSTLEGIIPALESSHAVFHALELAKTLGPDKDVLIGVSGRGDKDMPQVAKLMGQPTD